MGLSCLRPGGGMGQRFSRRESRPRRVGDDTDAIRHADHLDHARYGSGLGFVDLVGRGALDRRAEHSAIEHARHLHVDSITGGTVHLARDVDPHDILADQPELTRVLKLLGLDLGRLLQPRGVPA